MIARLAFAVVTAVIGGAWLFRAASRAAASREGVVREESGHAEMRRGGEETRHPGRPAGWLRTAALVWCAVWAAVWLGISLARLRYPFELEWAGGAMRDHCERILAGRPLYVAPGPDWIPFEYPPLYFWVSAALMRLLHDGSFVPMRLVSILSTLGSAAVLCAWVRQEAGTAGGRTWGLIAAGVFLASYRFTGAWYDIERLDMLFLFLSLLGGFWLARAFDLCTGGPNPPTPFPAVRPVWDSFATLTGKGETNSSPLLARDERPGERLGEEVSDSAIGRGSHSLAQADRPLSAGGGLMESTSVTGVRELYLVLSAIAFWLAFLTKQQALLFLVGGALALACRRQWRRLALFGALSAFLCGGSVVLLNRATGGWFGYYCFHVPLANGIRLNLAAQYFTIDLPLYAPAIAVIIVVMMVALRARTVLLNSRPVVTPAALAWIAMGLIGSLLSRAHWGGDQNVLIAGFVALALLVCILAARLETHIAAAAIPLYALTFAQLLTLVYRPDQQIPNRSNRESAERYETAVRRLESDGEVLCLDHGGISRTRHFHLMGLLDVIGSQKALPTEIAAALRSHRYSAILSDAKPEPGGALEEMQRDYTSVENLGIESPWVATGFPTPSPGRTVWVLLPRR